MVRLDMNEHTDTTTPNHGGLDLASIRIAPEQPAKRGPGRPLGVKNKPAAITEDPEPWINSREACKHLGISKPTLERWVKDGRLTPKRTPSGQYRFRRHQLDAVLA